MKEHSEKLVNQAIMVSDELIRYENFTIVLILGLGWISGSAGLRQEVLD